MQMVHSSLTIQEAAETPMPGKSLEDLIGALAQVPEAKRGAVRNNGGIVIAQVERVSENGRFRPMDVKIPGIFVDAVVVARPENSWRNPGFEQRDDEPLAGADDRRLRPGRPLDLPERTIAP